MIHELATPTPKPLGISSQTNSPISTPKGSPNKKRLQAKLVMASTPSSSTNSSVVATLNTLQNEYNNLERTYADLLLRSNSISKDKLVLEQDVQLKAEIIAEQSDKIKSYEAIIKSMKVEYGKNLELYEKELFYYKELVGDLEVKISKLSSELEAIEPQGTLLDDNSGALEDITKKYKDLLKDFKILQSNFEVEQSSKLVLMDQIEFIAHERDNRKSPAPEFNHHNFNDEQDEHEDFLIDDKEIHMDTFHTLNALQEQSDSESDSDNEAVGKHGRMMSLADEITSSSPIKDIENKRVSSVLHNPGFKFPPSPDPDYKQKQRQSLPTKLKTSSPHLDQEEFVLSPLKLTANHNGSSSSYFDLANSSITKSERRYSSSKPHHSRYNSHDIFPIKVEFEQLEPGNSIRAASVPERIHNAAAESRRQSKNAAFQPETSIEEGQVLNRNSILTESSSKRSSLLMDQSILTNDMTKQEIMKLKFELQSLKLHNEKLLSYIGFELQKQKKNIKKLSHKQSLNSMKNNTNSNMEYSDAKLIEKSREMLIHKKRVLRSVSINPIMSKRGVHGDDGSRSSQIISKGLLRKNNNKDSSEGLLGFPYQFFDGEDEYGFLNEPNHGSRLFDSGLKNYYEIDGDLEDDDDGLRGPKKYKSQIFRHAQSLLSDYSEEIDIDEENDEDVDDSWQDMSESDGDLAKKDQQFSVFNHIKGLFMSENTSKKHKNINDSVDESLKYKFFTIAVGILIIGIRFSHTQNIHSQ